MPHSPKLIHGLLNASLPQKITSKSGVAPPLHIVNRAKELNDKYFGEHHKLAVKSKLEKPVKNLYKKNLILLSESIANQSAYKKSESHHNGDTVRTAYKETNHLFYHKVLTHPEFTYNVVPPNFINYPHPIQVALISTVVRDINKDFARDNMTASREELDNRNKSLYGDSFSPPAYQHIIDILLKNPSLTDEQICEEITFKALLKTSPEYDKTFGVEFHKIIPPAPTEKGNQTKNPAATEDSDEILENPVDKPKMFN